MDTLSNDGSQSEEKEVATGPPDLGIDGHGLWRQGDEVPTQKLGRTSNEGVDYFGRW